MDIKQELISRTIGTVCGLAVSLVIEQAIPAVVKAVAEHRSKKEEAIDTDAFEVVESEES